MNHPIRIEPAYVRPDEGTQFECEECHVRWFVRDGATVAEMTEVFETVLQHRISDVESLARHASTVVGRLMSQVGSKLTTTEAAAFGRVSGVCGRYGADIEDAFFYEETGR